MTDPTTAAPYDAGDAAPAVSYRLPTGDEREQLRAEVARLRAELERITAGRDHIVELHEDARRELRELRRDLARIAGERNHARDERDAARQLVGELQAALVHVADRLHEIERYARRQADAEPNPTRRTA